MKRRNEIRNITLVGMLAGLVYTVLADDLSNPAPVINGILIGTIGGFFAAVIELFIFQPQVNRPEFVQSVFLKVVTYLFMVSFLVLAVKGIVDSLFSNQSLQEYYSSKEFRNFFLRGEFRIILLYCFGMIFLIIFTVQVSKYLGRGVLWNLITGRYHTPGYENRILLLIDMKGSTSIAEKLDPITYYMLLDRFYFDIYAGARPYGGIVYRYVGDQVTLMWPLGNKEANANCIRAFFNIRHQVHMQREIYLNQFGFVPEFKGTGHCGELVTGEIGDLKSQIVYYGTPLLEVAQLEKIAGRSPDGLCLSQELIEKLQLPSRMSLTVIDHPATTERHLVANEITEDHAPFQ